MTERGNDFVAFAKRTVASRVSTLGGELERARLDRGVEEVHDLRVAARRTVYALDAFRTMLECRGLVALAAQGEGDPGGRRFGAGSGHCHRASHRMPECDRNLESSNLWRRSVRPPRRTCAPNWSESATARSRIAGPTGSAGSSRMEPPQRGAARRRAETPLATSSGIRRPPALATQCWYCPARPSDT